MLHRAAHLKAVACYVVLHFGKALPLGRKGLAGDHPHTPEAQHHLIFVLTGFLTLNPSSPSQRQLTLTYNWLVIRPMEELLLESKWLDSGWMNWITSSPLLVLDNGVSYTSPTKGRALSWTLQVDVEPRDQGDFPGNQTRRQMLKTQKTPENGTIQQNFT